MMEYVEGCMGNDGNYSYMSGWANIWWCGNKMVKELGYFWPWWRETNFS